MFDSNLIVKRNVVKPTDLRRQNSLMCFMQEWALADTAPKQEKAMANVNKYWRKMEKMLEELTEANLEKINLPAHQVEEGDMKTMRDFVINKWRKVNQSFKAELMDNTLLHLACREGYAEMVQFMLDPNSKSVMETEVLDVNVTNGYNRTPLMLCFCPPSFTVVAKKYGIHPDGNTGLLFPKGQKSKRAMTESDWIPPGRREERERIVAMLLQAGADATVTDMHDYGLLHYAAICGWEGSAELLIGAGADPQQACLTGETPLHFAVNCASGAAAEVLLTACPALANASDRDGERAIHVAVRCKRDRQYYDMLVDFHADLVSPNYSSQTPLKLACEEQDWETVNILLDLKVPQDSEALALLKGEAAEKIKTRLRKDKELRLKLEKEAEAEGASEAILKARRAIGQWVPYVDKLTHKMFYYNKVTRESRWEVPPDYVQDRAHVVKSVTFGMNFYH